MEATRQHRHHISGADAKTEMPEGMARGRDWRSTCPRIGHSDFGNWMKLAEHISGVEKELRSSVLGEYCWDWDSAGDADPDLELGDECEPAPEPSALVQSKSSFHLKEALMPLMGTDYGTEPSASAPSSSKRETDALKGSASGGEQAQVRVRCPHSLHLTGDQYMHGVLMPLMVEYQDKSRKLYWGLFILRMLVLVSAASATLLAALNFTGWVTVAIAAGATFQRWIDFQALPQRLNNVNLAIAGLRSEVLWWQSLSFVGRMKPSNLQLLVNTVEDNADAETSAILKSIKVQQNTAAELKKVQTSATKAIQGGKKLAKGGIMTTLGVPI